MLTGASSQTVNTDDTGYYQFTNLASEYYIITPNLEGYVFEPTSREIPNLTSDLSGINFVSSTASLCPAKMIYGKDSEEVELLRNFRDNILNKTPEGHEIIKLYYQWSPAIVKVMGEDEEFKEEVKELIDGVLVLIKAE